MYLIDDIYKDPNAWDDLVRETVNQIARESKFRVNMSSRSDTPLVNIDTSEEEKLEQDCFHENDSEQDKDNDHSIFMPCQFKENEMLESQRPQTPLGNMFSQSDIVLIADKKEKKKKGFQV